MEPLKPIRSAEDHRRALDAIRAAIEAEPGSAEADRLEVLAILVADYERRSAAIPPADPVAVLELAMQAQGRSQRDLAAVLGSRSRASEVLGRRRMLSAAMAERLAAAWSIPLDLLSRPYAVAGGRMARWTRRTAAAGAMVLIAFGMGGGALVAIHGQDLPEVGQLATYRPQTVLRRDASGRLLERRDFVPLDMIPAHVVKAFLAAEDRRFFDHGGTSLPAIARAAVRNIVNRGEDPEGGSTITQQVAKNLLLAAEPRSLGRKVREAILAGRIEAALSKERILEIYLNQIYFGGAAYGVAAAADTYFGKPLAALSVAEAASLAALPKAPNLYRIDLADNAGRARARRDWVLGRMASDGMITETAAVLARAEPLRQP
ncbi:transglycosylase domain-containing protein [Phreatobacter sp. AB_2022a]|uniref:transglycosylase domain-containing protein n=1 Tax=Phreatobacter sp. AB_2022a TaxID=3003134 RepID=UPI002286FA2E|nr:transglycosylase domain-containing protein [Phreatobacter sp. AB_2022a]MCZ0733891.1 transglycosylase domain-containing protein [Phreatobacter sp. AB_2022a]